MTRFLTASALAFAVLAPSGYAQISTKIETGYDDNPFRLADQFNPQDSFFLDGEVRLEHDFASGVTFDARVQHLASEDQDASQTQHALTLGYEGEASLFGKPTEYEFHIRGSGLDRTFVSRNTGLVGQFAGVDIPDRFNQTSLEARARADIALDEAWTLRLQSDWRTRDYEDYTGIGLSNLDYDQVYAHGRLRYWPNETIDAQLGISLGQRAFEDRRGRALDTGVIAGSDLEYSYFGLDMSWKYVFQPDHDLRLAYSFDSRDDNLTGYYDTSSHRTRLRYRYMPEWGNRFAAEIEYRDFNFDNIPSVLIVNEEEDVAPNDGMRYRLSYDRRLVNEETREIWVDMSLTYDDISSPNTAFAYDRMVARIGVSLEFGG